jgi:ribosome-associated protein
MLRRREADEADDTPSKTQRKKQMTALQDLGEELCKLSEAQLAEVPLPDNLREAVVEARRITQHGGKKRQMQYIGRLMRGIDAEPVREKLASWQGVSTDAKALQHRIERWRERLLEDETAVGEFISEFPVTDPQHLRSLLRAIRKERAENKPPRQYRELFRVLRDSIAPGATSTESIP